MKEFKITVDKTRDDMYINIVDFMETLLWYFAKDNDSVYSAADMAFEIYCELHQLEKKIN